MWMPVDTLKFEVIVASKSSVASSHIVGGLQQVVAEIVALELKHLEMLGFKVVGWISLQDKGWKIWQQTPEA
ncbi:hypothetical protein EVA_08072 [gut metagenome]|uniref:Uncharacterized protein n=1 Tax=gut metagenome TaxID=749906 RepID=J9GAF4_9ZZZZ